MLIFVVLDVLQNTPEGSVLLGTISYGKISFAVQDEGKNPENNPVTYLVSYNVPPTKVPVLLCYVTTLFLNMSFNGAEESMCPLA